MKYSEQLVVSGYEQIDVDKVHVLVHFNIVFVSGPAHPPKVKYSEQLIVSRYWFSLNVVLFLGTQGTGTGSL